jgi:selenocysteine-specific elongation factor
MLAGVGGIDAVLFVIAADEGIMPQTREHLAILDLLQVQGGVVALTKIDLINDPDWLDLVEEDIKNTLKNTVLADAPVVRISSRTREGVPELLHSITQTLADRPSRQDLGRPRLPVDRVFTMPGFGTVITGTLSDGSLQTGDEVEILPGGIRSRIRGLQTHKRKEDTAVPGSRTAVNLSGINVDEVKRGNVIAHPGSYKPTQRIDVRFRLLSDVAQPLQHNTMVKFFTGAAEILSRVRLLGSDELLPGQEGWLQLELSEPVVSIRGDHYILRRPSPGETLGGGVIIDSHPKKRHKRFSKEELADLEKLAHGTPDEVFLQATLDLGIAPLQDVVKRANLEVNVANVALQALIAAGHILILENDEQDPLRSTSLITTRGYWDQLATKILQEVDDYHKKNPLKRGISREELKSHLKLSTRMYNVVLGRLVSTGKLVEYGTVVHRSGHSIRFTPQQQRSADILLARFIASPFSPPTVKECMAEVGEEIFNAMIELKLLVLIPPDVVFRTEDYHLMVEDIIDLLKTRGQISAAEVRDHFNTSRRYVLALLEYLDAQGITTREGDVRHLKSVGANKQ